MNFTIETQSFGVLPTDTAHEPIQEYIIKCADTGEGFTVIPGFGGVLRQLALGPKSTLMQILRSPDSPQALFSDESYSNALLYPFPSRIRHGIYLFDGQAYTLPMNERARDNAMHGLVHPQVFRAVSQDITPERVLFTVQYNYNDPLSGYPFPFVLDVTYGLTPPPPDQPNRSCTLSVEFAATNTGSVRCPAAFGWHPYFTLNGEATDALTIDMPTQDIIELDSSLLPTGRVPFGNEGILPLKDRNLDSAFSVLPNPDGVTTILHSARQQLSLHVWQDPTFKYLVVYTPGRRDHIAIEPLTANVDAFNNGEGLSVLEPGQTLRGQIKVWLQ